LLFAAIYSKLNEDKELDNDQQVELINLKRKLVLKKDADQIRVVPQIQNNNLRDYKAVLKEAGAVRSHEDTPPWAANRKMFRAYRYFQDRLDGLCDQTEGKAEAIMNLLEKVNKATIVKIEVASHSDAYTLFESLNNRGVPLTAVDLIKNKLLAKLEKLDRGQIDNHFEDWNRLLKYLGDDYTVQERFFRQYYNAFKNTINSGTSFPIATRSNLIQIYEKIIDSDAKAFIDEIIEAGKCYSFILRRTDDEKYLKLNKPLLDLERIQGTPSYLLLLYLLMKKASFNLQEDHLCDLIQYLVRFFVRRNLTDIPPTRDLTRLFMGIIFTINGMRGDELAHMIKRELSDVSSDDDGFRKYLEGPIYSENSAVTRFILCSLEEREMNRESWRDLWAMDGKQYIWTIEHIFPQGPKIPTAWVNMIAGGDVSKAREMQAQHADRIGNLTITGFNSTLGNKSFEEKRNRKDQKGHFVGYKNGLYLNEDLKGYTEWTVDHIEKRTKQLTDESLKLFPL
jgi:hypothetical protein